MFAAMKHLCLAGSVAIALPFPAEAHSSLRSADGGAVHALVVGIDKYANVRQLQGSVGDAEDLAAVLVDDGVSDLRVLKDLEATRQAFVDEMTRLLDVSKAGDLVIVAYSGHGSSVPEYPEFKGLEPGGKTEEFIMADYDMSGPATGEVIANKEMKAWLSRFDKKGVDILLLADSCFGGGMFRGLPDFRVGRPSLRVVNAVLPGNVVSGFRPIPMTSEELRTDVSGLTHVTVLSGSDKLTPVPEVPIPSAPTYRGALSYAVARSFEGKAERAGTDVTTRRELFAYARQEVQHYSDNQRIDKTPSPTIDDPVILDRPVFRLVEAPEVPAPALASSLSDPGVRCPVRIALINGDASVIDAQPKPSTPFEVVGNQSESDLVWDLSAKQVIQSSGDIVKSEVDPAQIGGILERTAAISCIKRLADARPQPFGLHDGVKRYGPADHPIFEANDLAGRHLIVFNIAADGRLQIIWPYPGKSSKVERPAWSTGTEVRGPFGTDYVVAVSSSKELKTLIDWLYTHDDLLPSAAGLLTNQLQQARSQDPTVRIGAVSLYTSRN